MGKVIESVTFSEKGSYGIYLKTSVNQGLISDIKGGYMTIGSVSYLDIERLYFYDLGHKTPVTN